MIDETQAVQKIVEDLRKEVSGRFDSMQEDIKELTKALRDLIRIDGDIRRLQDSVGRIGRETEDHEKRVRLLEGSGVATQSDIKHADRQSWLLITAAASLLTALVVFLLTQVVGR